MLKISVWLMFGFVICFMCVFCYWWIALISCLSSAFISWPFGACVSPQCLECYNRRYSVQWSVTVDHWRRGHVTLGWSEFMGGYNTPDTVVNIGAGSRSWNKVRLFQYLKLQINGKYKWYHLQNFMHGKLLIPVLSRLLDLTPVCREIMKKTSNTEN